MGAGGLPARIIGQVIQVGGVMSEPAAGFSLPGQLRNLKLSAKVSLLCAGSALFTGIALISLAVWESGQYNTLAQSEVNVLIDSDLDHITCGVYNLVQTENEAVQQQVNDNLNVARYVLHDAGAVSLSRETSDWTVSNQFTGCGLTVRLPRMLLGGRPLIRNTDPATETPVVDEITRLAGESATLFQRMNEAGDMLRVATTITTAGGRRAIGTYIPGVNPDGTPNPVIAAILKDETYRGRAYVVDAWCLTAYEPIKDKAGRLVGMLYVGVKQKNVESRVRQAVLQTKVGRTGYVYVLGGQGEDRGRYIISQSGERDGEDIWETRDSDGHPVVQAIINRAVNLAPRELATERYRWQNPGEAAPRWKIARLAYYQPWDWVIGTSVYEDELQLYRTVLTGGRAQMTRIMGLVGLCIMLLVGFLGVFIAWTIARPVRHMTTVVETIIQGDFDKVVEVRSRDEIGALARTFNVMTSMLKQTIRELRRSESKYRGIIENALEGIFQSSLEGRILSANPAMARMLAYGTAEELVGRTRDAGHELYVHPEDRKALVATILREGTVVAKEFEWRRQDGGKRWISVSARLVRGDEGEPAFIEGLSTDITERRRSEEERDALIRELEAKNTELERFTYTVSHDLKGPLVTIKGFLGLLEEDALSGNREQMRSDISRISSAADKMHHLLGALLELSRIGRIVNEPEEIPLGDLVREALELATGGLTGRNVEVIVAPDLPVIWGDRARISEVLQNLVENAVKYMGPQSSPRIELGVRGSAPDRVLYVRDNGLGILPRYHQKIFELFTKLDPKAEGTGVGLAIVKRIIEVHGGRIWVESGGEEGGSTFCFTLPQRGPALRPEAVAA